MHNSLGIYFGIKRVAIIETKDKKIINDISFPVGNISEDDIENKVPKEDKLVIHINDVLKNSGITTKDVSVTLSGNDLIIRSFEIKPLPREELLTAIKFEAKKYIPFKTEDLISDFQYNYDRKNKKNSVLFFSIKNEIIDMYLGIINKLGLNIARIEYSAFSLLRLLELVKVKNKEVFGLLSVDLEEETNFLVLENGFPLFSRDINLSAEFETEGKKAVDDWSALYLERLLNEIRISLDYFRRKFSSKPLEKFIVIANKSYRDNIEKLFAQLGISFDFIDIYSQAGLQTELTISSIKAYSAALAKAVRFPLKVNLLSARENIRKAQTAESEAEVEVEPADLSVDFRFVTIGVILIVLFFAAGFAMKLPVSKEIKEIIRSRNDMAGSRVELKILAADKSYQELEGMHSDLQFKLGILDNLVEDNFYVTQALNVVAKIIPDGVWLTDMSFSQTSESNNLILRGNAYLDDRTKEFSAINDFYSSLESDPVFSKSFNVIDLGSLQREKYGNFDLTTFAITCKGDKK